MLDTEAPPPYSGHERGYHGHAGGSNLVILEEEDHLEEVLLVETPGYYPSGGAAGLSNGGDQGLLGPHGTGQRFPSPPGHPEDGDPLDPLENEALLEQKEKQR